MEHLVKYRVAVADEAGTVIDEGWVWGRREADAAEVYRLAAEIAGGSGLALDAEDLDAGYDETYPHPNSPAGREWREQAAAGGRPDPYTG